MTTENISREIERRERKQLFTIAVLAPIISTFLGALGILVTGIGIWVNAYFSFIDHERRVFPSKQPAPLVPNVQRVEYLPCRNSLCSSPNLSGATK